MHFVIDALGISKPGGGRTSVLMQLSSVFQLDKENTYTVVVDSGEKAFTRFPNVEQRIIRVPNRLAAHLVAQVTIPAVARLRKAALVHHTKHLGSMLNTHPYIVTINDMTTLRLPLTQSWIDVAYWKTVQRIVVRRATMVLAPSRDAKRDIIHYYGISEHRIRVVPYAPSVSFSPDGDKQADASLREQYGIDGRYMLFVGILALKKNLPTLVRAYSLLRKQMGYAGKLVIVGREYPQSSERTLQHLVIQLGLEGDVMFTGPVPDEHLPAFYRGADVFAFPSLHEGFGIVLLEAMASGIPVVASNTSSLPEVMDSAGLLVDDPQDENAWAHELQRILFDDQLRATLVERGLGRAREFSWKQVGQATIDSYLSVVGKAN